MLREKLQEVEVEKSLMQSEYEERIAKQQLEFQQQLSRIQSGAAVPTDFSPSKSAATLQSRQNSLSFRLPSEQNRSFSSGAARGGDGGGGRAAADVMSSLELPGANSGGRGRYDSDLAYSNELKHEDLRDLDAASREWLQQHMRGSSVGFALDGETTAGRDEDLLSPSERAADRHSSNDMFQMYGKPQDHFPQPKQGMRLGPHAGPRDQAAGTPVYSNAQRSSAARSGGGGGAQRGAGPSTTSAPPPPPQRMYGVYPSTPYASGPPLVGNAILNEVGVDALLYPHDQQIHRSLQPQGHPLRNALRSDIARKNTTKGQAPPAYASRGRSPPRGGAGGAGGYGAPSYGRSGASPTRNQQQSGYTNPHLLQMQQALNNSGDFDPLTYGQPNASRQGSGTPHPSSVGGKHGAQRFMTNTASRTVKLMEKDKPRLPTDFLGSQRTAGNWKWS